MEYDWDEVPVLSPTGKGRKKKGDKENHEKQRKNDDLYSGKSYVPKISCKHTAAKNRALCCADLLTSEAISNCKKWLYTSTEKTKQDEQLLTLIFVGKKGVKKERIPVCKSTFCSIFGE